jgi:hypothetical protein
MMPYVSERPLFRRRDLGFESAFLQRRVINEPIRALRKKEPRGSGAEEFFAARETNGSKGATRYLISVSAPSASARYGTTAALVSHAAALPAAVQQQPKRRSSSVLVHRSIRLQSSDRSQGANHAVDV